jgi:hypothetical protein
VCRLGGCGETFSVWERSGSGRQSGGTQFRSWADQRPTKRSASVHRRGPRNTHHHRHHWRPSLVSSSSRTTSTRSIQPPRRQSAADSAATVATTSTNADGLEAERSDATPTGTWTFRTCQGPPRGLRTRPSVHSSKRWPADFRRHPSHTMSGTTHGQRWPPPRHSRRKPGPLSGSRVNPGGIGAMDQRTTIASCNKSCSMAGFVGLLAN